MTASARVLLTSETLMYAPDEPRSSARTGVVARACHSQDYVRQVRVLSGGDGNACILQGGDGFGRGAGIDASGQPEQDVRAEAGLHRVGRGRADAVVGGDPGD